MVMFTKDGLGRYVTLGARVQHYNAGEIIQGRSLNGADFSAWFHSLSNTVYSFLVL